MDQRLEDVLRRDPVQEAEDLLGRKINTPEAVKDPLLGLAFLGHAFRVNEVKRAELKARGDSNYETTLEEYQAIVADLGFRKVLEVPFLGNGYGDDERPRNEFKLIYFRDNGGVLLAFDTFGGNQVNGGNFYYNWRFKPEHAADRDNRLVRVLSSYHCCCDSPESKARHDATRPRSEVYDRAYAGDKEARAAIDAWREDFQRHTIYVGHHDCREAIRHNMAKLEEFGTFVTPWVERPSLWLPHYMETKEEGHDYKVINEARIALLPDDVRRAITPAA